MRKEERDRIKAKRDNLAAQVQELKQELRESQIMSGMKDLQLMELKARVAELEEQCERVVSPTEPFNKYEIQDVLNRQPAQSLDALRQQVYSELMQEGVICQNTMNALSGKPSAD
jgi:hypothetical protein